MDIRFKHRRFNWWREQLATGKVEIDGSGQIENHFLTDSARVIRLGNFVRQERSHVIQTDLNDVEKFVDILRAIREGNESISIIDLSNVWWHGYIGAQGIHDLIKAAEPFIDQNTIWLFTYYWRGEIWTYFGFTTSHFFENRHLFAALANLVSMPFEQVLKRTRPLQGLNPDLAAWLPFKNDERRLESSCGKLLSTQDISWVRRENSEKFHKKLDLRRGW